MLLFSRRFPAFRARYGRPSASEADRPGTSHRTFTPRTRLALALGFVVAAGGGLLLGPHAGTGYADPGDNTAFWQAERQRTIATKRQQSPRQQVALQREQRQQAARQRDQRQGDQRQQARRQQVSYNALAYAQPQQPRSGSGISALFSIFDQPEAQPVRAAPAPAAAPKRRAKASKRPPAPSQLVCVRLCDGYHFPAPAGMTADDAGCAAACPKAPTRLYTMRNDRIVDSVSRTEGATYSRLPVALFYTRTRDETCTCGSPDPLATIMSDRSLRRGDRYMSENGFLIYQGAGGSRVSPSNFRPLAQSRGVPRAERRLLAAMERVSVPQRSQQAVVMTPPPGDLVMLRSSLGAGASAVR